MKALKFAVLGKNADILSILKRVIEQNDNWEAQIFDDEAECQTALLQSDFDILLFSSGLSESIEKELKAFTQQLPKDIRIIEHYGGGSVLLKSEVLRIFPEAMV